MIKLFYYSILFILAVEFCFFLPIGIDFILAQSEQEDCSRIKAEIQAGNILIVLPREC